MTVDPRRPADRAAWSKLAEAELRGADPDALVWDTPEGIPIKALYTAADIENLESDAFHHHPDEVFANIMNIAFHCADDHRADRFHAALGQQRL